MNLDQQRAEIEAALAADYQELVRTEAERAVQALVQATAEVSKMALLPTPVERYNEKLGWILDHLAEATVLLNAVLTEIADTETR